MSYKSALDRALNDEDILSLSDADRYIAQLARLNERYLAVTEQLADAVHGSRMTASVVAYLRQDAQVDAELQRWLEKKRRIDAEFSASDADLAKQRAAIVKGLDDPDVRKDVGKFVLDYSRSYLTAATRTSLGFSADARTLEEVITAMISSSRLEDHDRGDALWREARKVAPVLLGEKSHICRDPWLERETWARQRMHDFFREIEPHNYGRPMVHLVEGTAINQHSDRFAGALAAFQFLDASIRDIYDNLGRDQGRVRELLDIVHDERRQHDVLHGSLAHSGMLVELVMPYHAYRDIFRHRRGARSVQLLTMAHGFEVPEIFRVFGLDAEFMMDMDQATETYNAARADDPYIAEKMVPFAANCRALHSWSPAQIGYVTRLRGSMETGNRTYVQMAHELARAFAHIMPKTARFLKVDAREYPAELWKKGYGWFDATQRGSAQNAD
ncbi:hypothetical protein HY478_02675 [Candidatus Uhrbacteria bacterium]|nr:hypothetical protein [Candidatus Uhrbacteria bacterium]